MNTILRLDALRARSHLDELVTLLTDSVDNGASIGFLRPLAPERARDYWLQTFESVASNSRILLIANSSERIVGSVQLDLCMKQNGSHRAEVQKLMVLTRHRRHGIARELMTAIEAEARRAHRSLLVLDTELGSDAVHCYESQKWSRVGSIPDYAMSADGVPTPNVIYYKRVL